MKNKFKFFVIIAMVAVIGFGMTACGDGSNGGGGGSGGSGGSDSVTKTLTVSTLGSIQIQHNGGEDTGKVSVTTDLEAPNNSFSLGFTEGKTIYGLTPGTNVTVTISVSTGYFAHADVYMEGSLFGFQTYIK